MNSPADPILTQEFRKYLALLLDYHRVLVRGDDETPEAEDLRGEMEGLWEELSDPQRQSSAGLASDLNWVRRGLAPRAPRKEDVTRSDLQATVDALRGERWHDLLSHLRTSAAAIDPVHVASMRGRVWMRFAEPALALVFLAKARELDPKNGTLAFLALQCLQESDPQRALSRSVEILSHADDFPAAEVVKACDVRLASLRGQPPGKDAHDFAELAGVLDRTVVRLQLSGEYWSVPSLVAMAEGVTRALEERLGPATTSRHP
jgi:hypothetical protein